MDKFKMLRKADKSFIIENNLFDKIGKSLNINGETYYPILYRDLFLRYYIAYTGYLYDILNREIKRFNIGDKVLLTSTNDNSRNLYSINELIWRTFYRFPEGCYFPLDKKCKIECIQHHDKETGFYYTINGVEFRKVCFPDTSVYYNSFVIDSRYNLITSENGAVFDLRKKRFMRINIDTQGNNYIISKYGLRLGLEKVIAYAWECNVDNKCNVQKIYNFSPVKVFVDRFSIATHCKNESTYRHTQLICQDISPFSSMQNLPESFSNDKKGGSKWLYDDLGPKCQIPIEGLSDYTITKCGIIFSQMNTIVKPYKIIYKKKFIKDVLYKFTNIGAIFSIKDILLWTYYRLNYSAILNCYSEFVIHENLNIPIIIHSDIITKFPQVSYESAIIGEMLFTKMKGYPNYYISTTGAIYNAKHKYFIRMTNTIRKNGSLSVNIPFGNSTKWLGIDKLMYSSWYGYIPTRTKIITKNGICGDCRLSNLQLSLITPSTLSQKSIDKIKRTYNVIKSSENREKQTLKRLYGIDNNLEYDIFPIPEILRI